MARVTAGSPGEVLQAFRWLMAALLSRHGFWGIFLLAAWPNALFDLCGICCGHFLMPFWEFIGATMAGKALVKARILRPLPTWHAGRPHLLPRVPRMVHACVTLACCVPTEARKN